MFGRNIIRGEAGTRWTNETEFMAYQFAASMQNTCGTCLQYHLAISSFWPIPIHFGCRCVQLPIPPGAQAPFPFVDYRAMLAKMEPHQQAIAIGASNWKLLKAGVATWADIVTAYRVRDLAEVVSLLKLSVKQLLAARVRPADATRAVGMAGMTEEEHAERRRREQDEVLAAPMKSLSALILAMSAAKPAIVAGTAAAAVVGGVVPSHAEDLARAIAGWRRKRKHVEPLKS